MRREGSSTTFTVYFDGQFWVGIVERIEEGGLFAARVVFGAETNPDVRIVRPRLSSVLLQEKKPMQG